MDFSIKFCISIAVNPLITIVFFWEETPWIIEKAFSGMLRSLLNREMTWMFTTPFLGFAFTYTRRWLLEERSRVFLDEEGKTCTFRRVWGPLCEIKGNISFMSTWWVDLKKRSFGLSRIRYDPFWGGDCRSTSTHLNEMYPMWQYIVSVYCKRAYMGWVQIGK